MSRLQPHQGLLGLAGLRVLFPVMGQARSRVELGVKRGQVLSVLSAGLTGPPEECEGASISTTRGAPATRVPKRGGACGGSGACPGAVEA